MIFYFTGTGNSLAVARRLLGPEESLINMAEALEQKKFTYKVSDSEKVGFIFPVYFYTLPTVVRDFIENLQLENTHYNYAIITCGGGIAQAGAVLAKALEKKNMELHYVSELVMPDNYILLYKNMADGVEECLESARKRLDEIAKDIDSATIVSSGRNTLVSDLMSQMYQFARKTKSFYAQDLCTGCGMCERNCPEKVIRLVDGKPEWTKDKCSQCLACINRCPVRAIQYGKKTLSQGRYVHPNYK